ncbi:MAG TPA: SusC/RagA family TonB-linked outer membrane protein [Chitinophagaceae bacterium]|nr:SusC/RagA family TonB-linked outer membrane protein [Chitinophagaceae bacterium]
MKLTLLFMIAGLLNAQAKSFSQTVTFSGKNVAITKVFQEIESQTGYTVFANKDLLKAVRPVSVSVKNMPLNDFLSVVLTNQPVGYEIHNRTIFITTKNNVPPASQGIDNRPANDPPYIEITGVVKGEDGQPLEGATVSIKGSRTSVVTNAEGRFTINALMNQTLVISYVGFESQEISVGDRTTVEITLKKAEKQIETVVVTALGIQRRSKSLTYNVQEVKGEDISTVNNGSFVNSLAGKIAGATINSSSAGTGASSRVVLRGLKSIYGNNNALYVIDGIPMPNIIRGQAEDIFSGAGQTGDFVANINPDDIESLSVLSGPSAAALYGSAAANGVIIINTKKGQRNKTDFVVSNTTSFSSPLILPKFQNTYGQSEIGSYYSWGDKLTTPSSYKPADFFQTGVNSTTSLSFSTGTEKSQTYISVANVTSKGIIPNNDFKRSNFTARNTSTFLDDRMNLDVSFMAGLIDEKNMISQGQYFNPLVAVYLFPPGDDFNRVKAFERYNASRNLMTQFWPYGDNGLMMQNPYWVTTRDVFSNKKERYMTTVSLRYKAADWINLSGRVKLDKANDRSTLKFAASTNQLFASENGFYALNTLDNRQIYAEGLANINKAITKEYNFSANIGAALEDIQYHQYMYGGKLAGVANLYTYANVNRSTSEMLESGYSRQKQSVFGSAQFSYKNMIYLDLTARNDWASTLAEAEKQSFFYSSIGASAVLTDLFDIRSDKLSYLKLRASYSEVGNEPRELLTIPTYPLAGGFPVTQTRMPNPDLKPELTKSIEAGLNSAFFNGALRLDATVYFSRTYNQFFEPTLSSASGFTSVIVNAGRVDNKGVEISARYTQQFGQLSWTSFATYSLNKNKIVQLLPGWTNPVTGEVVTLRELDMSGTGSYKMVLKEGGAMGDIYVNTLRVDEHGAIYVDPSSQTVAAEPNKFVYAGNNNPKYNVGWGNNLKWKGIGLNFLLTARVGGIVVSNTQAIMDAFGVSQASADAREAGGALVNGRPIPAKEYYQVVGAGASGGIASMYTYSATNIRLAELSLGYDIPVRKFGKVLKGATVAFVGRNLALLYNKAPFDPELTSNTQTYFQGIDYFMMPSLRSLGFSVRLNF